MFKHIQGKNVVKYFGVLINNNLSWTNHVDYIVLKISIAVGIISRLRHFLLANVLLNIYRSLINNSWCSNVFQVDMLYLKSIPLIIYDIQSKTVPPDLLHLFIEVDSVHSY